MKNQLRVFRWLVAVLALGLLTAGRSLAAPFIFTASPSARPGDAISLQGEFGAGAKAYLSVNGGPATSLAVLTQSAGHCTVQVPAGTALGLYQVWVEDQGQRSPAVYVNRAWGQHFDSPDVNAGGTVRLYGRNLSLPGATPTARFVDMATGASQAATIDLARSGPFVLTLTGPAGLAAGATYRVLVSNGYGGAETEAGQRLTGIAAGPDPFRLGVPWGSKFTFSANVYNVRTDSRLTLKATGDGQADDRPALQAAIDRASADGGGVVYLPAGTYKLGSGGLNLAARVVVQGAGRGSSVLTFGHGTPRGGQGIAWNNAPLAGLADLTYRNVNEGGRWQTNLGAYGSSHEIFMVRTQLELSSGGGIYWEQRQKALLQDCQITQTYDPDNRNGGPLTANGTSFLVFRRNTQTGSTQYGATAAHDWVLEDNAFRRDAAVYVPGRNLTLNFCQNIAILGNSFEVINGPDKTDNDGETILTEGGGDQRFNDAGTVTGASATTLRDTGKNWSGLLTTTRFPGIRPVVAIVSGPGLGQWREVTAATANELTLDRPWDVVPTTASHYTLVKWSAANWLIANNSFAGHGRGILFYEASTRDVAVHNNRFRNSGGIWLRSGQNLTGGEARFDIVRNVQITDNYLVNTTTFGNQQAAHILVEPALFQAQSLFGTLVLGAEVRGNSIQGIRGRHYFDNYTDQYANSVYSHQPPSTYTDAGNRAILGTIFQNNTARNTDVAFFLNSAAHDTYICGTTVANVGQVVEDAAQRYVPHASVNTAACPASAPVVLSGYYQLVSKLSGQALDVNGASFADGAPVIQWPVHSDANQQWQLTEVGGGTYQLLARHSGKALDVSGGPAATADGVPVQQYGYGGGLNQQWRVEAVGGGFYKVLAAHSGKALTVRGASRTNAAVVEQSTYTGADHQLWRLTAVAGAATVLKAAPGSAAVAGDALRLYPNPATDALTLTYTLAAPGPVQLRLLDALGRPVFAPPAHPQAAGVHQQHLRLPALPPGLYSVVLVLDGRPVVRQLVVTGR